MDIVLRFGQLIDIFSQIVSIMYFAHNAEKLKDAKTIDGPKTEENQKLPRTMWEIYDKYWRPFG